MGDIYLDCYQCGKNCINTQFCADGGSFDSSNLQLPRTLKIRVIANPDFWGFGSIADNTLIEGWGTFTNGYFDFFDGFDEDHSSLKVCGSTTTGPYANEQRPDVKFRSVYDPENVDAHYSGTTNDGIIRGGAEGYLLDRAATQTTDSPSCDTTSPLGVFKWNPSDYGTFPKIMFNNRIYKNATGGWRIEECNGCYTNTGVVNTLRVYDCSGNPKQHIQGDNQFSNQYDPFQHRCVADNFTGESGCNPDGTIAAEYQGSITGIVRDTGVSPFLQYHFQYNGVAASGLANGKTIAISGSSENDGYEVLFNVTHQSGYSTAYAVGSNSDTDFLDASNSTWILLDSYDPNTCCGGAAYGVDSSIMNLTNSPNYHTDIGRVFNNPKNVIFSNRLDRTYNSLTVVPHVADGTAWHDPTYPSLNESGKVYTDASGLLFEKERPYYGTFYDTDRWDNTTRQAERGTREVNKNGTCYTKNGSLTVYPDCLTQWTQYTSCDPQTKYTLTNVPRLALVYRGCDYDDPCTFDPSGRPWTAGASGHPSTMEDLVRGFGGQEIQLFINLGTARGAEIKRDPCCCVDPCPGTHPPVFVEIPSPVSYPCFPKFDLYPSGYGCQDPLYYLNIMQRLNLDTNPSGSCALPFYNACTPVQPYTTYGYIRNLCGKETNSRRAVINSLAQKLHTGDYDDLNHTDNTVEPMYVSFEPDTPDCCPGSGFPVGSEECSAVWNFDTYGTGAQAELVTDSTGNITYNILHAGAGYQFGGWAAITTPVLYPTPTASGSDLVLTFGGAADSLQSITHPVSGQPFNTTFPLSITAGQSGVVGSGGYSYNACNSSDRVHYWGLTDYQGRLSFPYFRTKTNTTTICGTENGPFVDYSDSGTLANGWPKDKVPFLVEIDHEEYCSSCNVTQMPTGNLTLSATSLKTEYSHGDTSDTNNSVYSIYGWNHCQYPGTAITPYYNTETDSWASGDYCVSGDGLGTTFGQPYTGQTCNCADGFSVTMVPRKLVGTDVPIGYVTSGSVTPEGTINSYVPFGNCGLEFAGFPPDVVSSYPESVKEILEDHVVYMKGSLSCSNKLYGSAWINYSEDHLYGSFDGDGLTDIYGCGGCATSFPAPNSTPNLDLDFWFVRAEYQDIFTNLDDKNIFGNTDFLLNGLSAVLPEASGTNLSINLNINGCEGSKIKLWGCTPYSGVQSDLDGGGFYGQGVVCGGGEFGGSGTMAVDCVQTGASWDPGPSILNRSLKYTALQAMEAFYLPSEASGDGGQASLEMLQDCLTYGACCTVYDDASIFPNKILDREWRTCLQCYCDDFEDEGTTLLGEATYTNASGWRIDKHFDGDIGALWWSGENIPSLGNIGVLPTDEPIAIRYDNSEFSNMIDNPSISVEPFCNYHTGPNRYAYVGAELFEPFRADGRNASFGDANNMVPSTCTAGRSYENMSSGSPFYSTCGTPVPFDTYAGGIGSGIRVNKKSCWPEVMTVHKVECVASGYKLHVSREYFEHDRVWYYWQGSIVPRLGLIEGGETSAKYTCDETYPVTCADPGTGVSPTNLDASFALNMMTPADSLTPVYPDTCATGTEPFFLTPSSVSTYRFGSHTTSEFHDSGCLYYPNLSGQQFWNFYNLLYDLNDPTTAYDTDAGGGVYENPPDPDASCNDAFPHNLSTLTGDLDPVFASTGAMKYAHSCVQDYFECGADLWCNKEFFPRRRYNVNTRITRFAALSICEQNAQYENPVWYEGHETTWDSSPNKDMLVTGPFLDACDDDAVVLMTQYMDIDDNVLFIPFTNKTGSTTSIETLMGVLHPGFKSNFNEKTCIYADSGTCLDYLPEHNDTTIRDITFTRDKYGYYLNDLVSSGGDSCLFSPFKIMVDVECCADRIGHKGTSDPTNLNYMARVPAHTCDGWISSINCTCDNGNNSPYDSCQAWDQAHDLPGLVNLNVRVLNIVAASGETFPGYGSHPGDVCYTGCASDMDEYNNMSGEAYYWQPTSLEYYLIDPSGNNPDGRLTLVESNGSIVTDATPCDLTCQVTTGMGPPFEYNYHLIDSFADVYEYEGIKYTLGPMECIDAFSYKGSMYRFCSNEPGEDGSNCCVNGCGCTWNVCSDYEKAIKIMDSGVDPSGYLISLSDIQAESCPESGVLYTDFYPHFDCFSYINIKACPYNSNVLFNITESV